MKLMRLAAFVAAFAVVGGVAMAEDADVRALQAKLAAQEARLNDLQAKMYGAANACEEPQIIADGMTSLRKNAVITIGGVVNTRYHSRNGKLESSITPVDATVQNGHVADDTTAIVAGEGYPDGPMRTVSKRNSSQFHVSDALLQVKIDVNDYFDAYAQFNFNDNNRGWETGMAENYWIRWKNVCNTGFGLLVGRDRERHGGIGGMSIYDNWQIGREDSASGAFAGWGPDFTGADGDGNVISVIGLGEGMFNGTSVIPVHSTHGNGRVTQINPYWETQDGAYKVEASFFQGMENTPGAVARYYDGDGVWRARSINDGAGGMSFRITAQPIEGLKLIASVKNLYARGYNGNTWSFHEGNSAGGAHGIGGEIYDDNTVAIGAGETAVDFAKNNTSVFGGFEYTPCFFNRATLWASYMHGWNEGWVKDQDSASISFGLNFKVTDQFPAFAAGDWLRVKNDQGHVWHKANGWASDVGLQYTLPYGVTAQVGWRHEVMKYKDRENLQHTKFTGDTIYGHLGFSF